MYETQTDYFPSSTNSTEVKFGNKTEHKTVNCLNNLIADTFNRITGEIGRPCNGASSLAASLTMGIRRASFGINFKTAVVIEAILHRKTSN